MKEKIKSILEEYLKSLNEKNKFEDIETILKIDHLRDAITANMVGIINFLMIKKGYFGKIVLENLDETTGSIGLEKNKTKKGRFADLKEYSGEELKMIDTHFYQSNTDISRRLEWSLYRKFQETGLVPPQIKQSVFLRDDFGIYKFGIIEFVKVGGTSSTCPYCNLYCDNKPGLKKHHKNDNCGFNEQTLEYEEFRDENNSINYDKIAAFTIGKYSFEGKIPEFEKNKKKQESKNNYTSQKQETMDLKNIQKSTVTFQRSSNLGNKKK